MKKKEEEEEGKKERKENDNNKKPTNPNQTHTPFRADSGGHCTIHVHCSCQARHTGL